VMAVESPKVFATTPCTSIMEYGSLGFWIRRAQAGSNDDGPPNVFDLMMAAKVGAAGARYWFVLAPLIPICYSFLTPASCKSSIPASVCIIA
jgi:hypothetical protein